MDQLEQTVGLVRDILGRDLLGTYLHGSVVCGGLNPASDLDILAVTLETLDDPKRRVLTEGLLEISAFTATARPLELTVVVQSEVRPWRFPPVGDFLWGEWLRDDLRKIKPPQPSPMPDLAVTITMVLAGDQPLTGPSPGQLLDPVPHADLISASLMEIPKLLDDLADDTRNVVLTLARIWTTFATGQIKSKDAAADWALAHLSPEHRPVLEHARYLYRNCRYENETWGHELKGQVRTHVAEVLTHIDNLRRQR